MPRPRSRAVPALMALAGLVLLLTAPADLARSRPTPGDFGATAAPSAPARPTPPTPTRRSATATPSRPTPAAPTELAIPAIHVRATVVPIGATAGILDVPADPAHLGWWSASAPVGAASGSVVVDGHVDSAATGPGALFHLTDLRAGDRLVLTTTTRDQHSYLVTGRRVYPKTNGLPADLFTTNGAPRLVLITCGGPFDRTAGSYLDNIIVFAAPEVDAQ
jgi:sortase (surface protein transpeptidase)